MTDALITTEMREEALSRLYVHAVATGAGYTTSTPSPDCDGVDLQIQAGGAMRPALHLQLKATVNLEKNGKGDVRYPLKIRNYNLLREETQTPRLLVVLDLPRDEERWMTITVNELVLRNRAYWLSLREFEGTTNTTSVTVEIPEKNLFNIENLIALMDQSRGGSVR